MLEFIRLRLGTSRCKTIMSQNKHNPTMKTADATIDVTLGIAIDRQRNTQRSSKPQRKRGKSLRKKETHVGRGPDANENKEKEKRTVVELVGACVITGVTCG